MMMKKKHFLIYLLPAFLLFSGCSDDDSVTPDSITTVLQRIMNENSVNIIEQCSQSFGCAGALYFQNEYEFIGESMLRLDERFFDLTQLRRYSIATVDDVRRIQLFFE